MPPDVIYEDQNHAQFIHTGAVPKRECKTSLPIVYHYYEAKLMGDLVFPFRLSWWKACIRWGNSFGLKNIKGCAILGMLFILQH